MQKKSVLFIIKGYLWVKNIFNLTFFMTYKNSLLIILYMVNNTLLNKIQHGTNKNIAGFMTDLKNVGEVDCLPSFFLRNKLSCNT